MKIGVVSLGCPKNQVDSENLFGILKAKNYTIENDEKNCDVIIVNTCGFIDDAKEESINTILEMAEYKKEKCKALIVTGCMAQRYKEEIIKEMPEVDAVLGTTDYMEIKNVLDKALTGIKSVVCNLDDSVFTYRDNRVLSSMGAFGYLKIAEGCSNRCTYCIIPELRGKYRSRYIEDLLEEAKYLISNGKSEIILIAQDVTGYGKDLYGESRLVELLQKLTALKDIKRVRLLYTYPDEVSDELIEEIKNNVKICKYLDIPIQHISDDVLNRMKRRGRKKDILMLMRKLRRKIPGITLRTSLIVGFPGESDKDFVKLVKFVKKYKFDRLGVFKYSKEEGTEAYKFFGQCSEDLKEIRYNRLMEVQRDISESKNKSKLGSIIEVVVEGIAEDGIFYYGRSESEAPDIDGIVYFTSSEPIEINNYMMVRILNFEEYDLIGEAVNESSK